MKISPEVAYKELQAQYEHLRQRNLLLAQALSEATEKLEEIAECELQKNKSD